MVIDWVSEFSHESIQKLLSYFTGWTSTMAWQAGNAIGVFLTGTLIQVIILENNPDYLFPTWQGSLLVMAIIVLVGVINIFGAKLIPKLQNAIFAAHVLAYICFVTPIWVNAPKASAKAVFTSFSNSGGWSSTGFAVLAGQLSGIYTQVGVDTAAHIAEEVKGTSSDLTLINRGQSLTTYQDASKAVPRAMMSVYLINFVLIFFAIITTCFAMPDLSAALSDPSLYATVYVLRQSMSTAWLTVVLGKCSRRDHQAHISTEANQEC
jgi:choline transport protein